MTKPAGLTRVAAALVTAGLAPVAATPRQSPELGEVIKRVTEYHTTYAQRVSGVTLEEQYQLINVTSGKMQPPVRIASDVTLVNVNGRVAALRDIFSVDTRPLRERTPRIAALLSKPGAAAADWETAIRLPLENLAYFALDIIAKVNEPTTALRFIAAGYQDTLKYKLEGKRKLNGVEAVGMRFDEPVSNRTKYQLGTRRNGRAFGRIWLDPVTGAIHQTELWVESKGETASVSVKYVPHPTLGLLLPSETSESYEEREMASGPADRPSGMGFSSQLTFQASAKYSNATYSPIDLKKLKK
jgi:hypothetical protein